MMLKGILKPLFDATWYSDTTGIKFESVNEAFQHYIDTGEKNGYFPNPIFDPVYYRCRYGLSENQNSLFNFIEVGMRELNNPNRYFNSEWYLWQNPEAKKYKHPILHYLEMCDTTYRDPSPCVDMLKARKKIRGVKNACLLLNKLIISKHLGAEIGVVETYEQLVVEQKKFIDSIKLDVLKQSENKRKYLLWVQCAEGSNFFDWFSENKNRKWDLLLNYYDNCNCKADGVGDYILKQKGTKFTGVFNVWRNTTILDNYQYILFIDDDLVFDHFAIDHFFEIMENNKLDLAQPSLSKTSQCVWPVFFNKSKNKIRYTNGVEIMMPAFSKNAIEIFAPYFSTSVSGFGLDLLFANIAKINRLKVGVVDSIVAHHNKIIDQDSGAYYTFLRKNNINAKSELWFMQNRYDLELKFYEVK